MYYPSIKRQVNICPTQPPKLKFGAIRDLSCLLLCSLLLKARLQYWHLYFFSGAVAVFRGVVGDSVVAMMVAKRSTRSEKPGIVFPVRII